MNYTLEFGGIEIGKGVQSAMGKGSIDELDYRIHGQFLLSENSQLPPIPFDKRGTVER